MTSTVGILSADKLIATHCRLSNQYTVEINVRFLQTLRNNKEDSHERYHRPSLIVLSGA